MNLTAVAVIWILTANLIAAFAYPRVTDVSGALVYLLAGNLIVLGWIFGAWYKVPLSILGPALGAGFPLVCLGVGWYSGEAVNGTKLALLLAACGLVATASLLKA